MDLPLSLLLTSDTKDAQKGFDRVFVSIGDMNRAMSTFGKDAQKTSKTATRGATASEKAFAAWAASIGIGGKQAATFGEKFENAFRQFGGNAVADAVTGLTGAFDGLWQSVKGGVKSLLSVGGSLGGLGGIITGSVTKPMSLAKTALEGVATGGMSLLKDAVMALPSPLGLLDSAFGALFGSFSKGFEIATELDDSYHNLSGQLGTTGADFDKLKASMRATSEATGMLPKEADALATALTGVGYSTDQLSTSMKTATGGTTTMLAETSKLGLALKLPNDQLVQLVANAKGVGVGVDALNELTGRAVNLQKKFKVTGLVEGLPEILEATSQQALSLGKNFSGSAEKMTRDALTVAASLKDKLPGGMKKSVEAAIQLSGGLTDISKNVQRVLAGVDTDFDQSTLHLMEVLNRAGVSGQKAFDLIKKGPAAMPEILMDMQKAYKGARTEQEKMRIREFAKEAAHGSELIAKAVEQGPEALARALKADDIAAKEAQAQEKTLADARTAGVKAISKILAATQDWNSSSLFTKNVMDGISKAMVLGQKALSAFGKVLDKVIAPQIDTIVKPLGEAFESIGKILDDPATSPADKAAKIGEMLKGALSKVGALLKESLKGPLAEAMKELENVLGQIWPPIKKALGAALDDLWKSVKAWFKSIDWGGVLIDSLIGLGNMADSILSGIFGDAWKNWQSNLQKLIANADWYGLFLEAMKPFVAIGDWLIDNVWNPIRDEVGCLIFGCSPGIVPIFKQGWDLIKKGFSALWDIIKAGANIFIGWFKTAFTAISDFLGGVWDGITTAATAVWDGLKAGWEGAGAVVDTVWTGIKDGVSGAWDGIESVISTGIDGLIALWDGLKDAVGAVWDFITDAPGKAWTGIKTGVQAIADGITSIWTSMKVGAISIFTSIYDAISSAFTKVKDFVTGAVKSVITGLGLDTIGDKVAGIFSAILGAVKAPIEFIKGKINDWIIDNINKLLDWDIPIVGLGTLGKELGISHLAHLAKGGLVNKPTTALIGEAGPEVVIPLDKLSSILSVQIAEALQASGGMTMGGMTALAQRPAEMNEKSAADIATMRMTLEAIRDALRPAAAGGPSPVAAARPMDLNLKVNFRSQDAASMLKIQLDEGESRRIGVVR